MGGSGVGVGAYLRLDAHYLFLPLGRALIRGGH